LKVILSRNQTCSPASTLPWTLLHNKHQLILLNHNTQAEFTNTLHISILDRWISTPIPPSLNSHNEIS
jgi:hypothetical protein